MKIKRIFTLFVTLTICNIVSLFNTSCKKDNGIELLSVVSEQFSNLSAKAISVPDPNPVPGAPPFIPGGDYTKFNFSKGDTVSGDDWDIAFRSTIILVNGGASRNPDEPDRTGEAAAYIATGTLASVASIKTSSFRRDKKTEYAIPTGSGNGWYNYNPGEMTITSIAGRIIVIKTHNNRYAKMEILSYYKNAPSRPDNTKDIPRFYTFRYVYQPNENTTNF